MSVIKLIGDAPNQVSRNRDLGSMAYQDLNNVVIEGGTLAGLDIQSLADQVSADAVNTGIVNAEQFLAGSSAVLRGGSTNLVTYSEDFENPAIWVKTTATVTTNNAIAPDGTLTADTYTATGTSGQLYRVLTGYSGTHVGSVWIRRRTGSGVVNLKALTGTAFVNITAEVTTSWKRFTIPASLPNGTTYYFGVQLVTNGDEIDLWGAQLNLGSTPQPYLKTVATAVTTAYAAPLESPNGLALPLLASMTPARNADMTFELASDTTLVVKVKGSDGTVRSATLTLA